MWPFSRQPVVPVLRFSGPIGMATPLRPGLTLRPTLARSKRRSRFRNCRLSRSSSIHRAARRFSRTSYSNAFARWRKRRKSASTSFARMLLHRADIFSRLQATKSTPTRLRSLARSASSRAASDLSDLLARIGVERRVYTAGANKNQLDPFLPEDPDDVSRLKAIQQDVHDVFIGLVKERRLGKLKAPDGDLFSGAFWSAAKAEEFGLIDGITDIRSKMRRYSATRCGSKSSRPREQGSFLGSAVRLALLD